MKKSSNNTSAIVDSEIPIYGALGMSFMQFPVITDLQHSDTDVVVSGVPYDMSTSGRSGARFGPDSVRQASSNLVWEGARWPWTFALDDHLSVTDIGNVIFKHGEPQTLVENLEAHIGKIMSANKIALTIGGDHFITLPILRAYAKKHGPVAVIHVDAHTDTYSGGTKYDHGTLFHHAIEEGLIDVNHSIQIGIRTAYDYENHPIEVLDAAWVNENGAEATLERIKQRVGNKKVYVSFDIDALDPAFAPGTGTPVSGGLLMDTALKMVRGLKDLNLIGMDVVEVAPAYDHAEITSLAAATLALEFLYALAAKKSTGGDYLNK